jgi:hypothetical protein
VGGALRRVALGSDRAVLRQVRQHRGETHAGLALEAARLLRLDHLARFMPSIDAISLTDDQMTTIAPPAV